MKTSLLLATALFFTLSASAQHEDGFTNKTEARNKTINGLKEGKWLDYSSISFDILPDSNNSQYYVLDTYRGGKLNGVARFYQKNGTLLSKDTYRDGEKNGPLQQYFPNGKVNMDGNFLNDKPDGAIRIYAESGQLEEEQNYANGKRNGEQKTYHENGKLRSIATYVNGEENGVAKTYYDDGRLWTETPYTNGVKGQKKEYTYDKNGNASDVREMKKQDSIRQVEVMKKMKAELKHRLDSENAPLKVYDSGYTNKALANNAMMDGKREGKWVIYSDKQGKATEDESMATNYILVIYHQSNPCGMLRGYYMNGNVYSKIFYQNGIKTGRGMVYWPNGNMMVDESWDYNELTGVWKDYWENGNLKAEKHYDNGVENGLERTYHEDGTLKSESNYKDGTVLGQ